MILLLVLFDEPLINAQPLTTSLHKLPAYTTTQTTLELTLHFILPDFFSIMKPHTWYSLQCKRLPKHLLELFHFVIRIFLRCGIIKESSSVGQWSSIHLAHGEQVSSACLCITLTLMVI